MSQSSCLRSWCPSFQSRNVTSVAKKPQDGLRTDVKGFRVPRNRSLVLSEPALRATVFSRAVLFALNSMEPRIILIHLLLKLGVAAGVSASLVRSKEFKALLFREERSFQQKAYLVLCMALPI